MVMWDHTAGGETDHGCTYVRSYVREGRGSSKRCHRNYLTREKGFVVPRFHAYRVYSLYSHYYLPFTSTYDTSS